LTVFRYSRSLFRIKIDF